MKNHEKNLAATFLRLASEAFGNNACNDVDESVFKDWTKEQRQEFCKEFRIWNGDPEEYDPEWLYLPDYAIMDFLADKIQASCTAPST
jgi:hypothetical protein